MKLMKLMKKIYYQIKLIQYLKSGNHVNIYRVNDQIKVLLTLIGFRFKDHHFLSKYLINLNHLVSNEKLFKLQLKRISRYK